MIISHHADRAAALLEQLPKGALPSERAAVVQKAIDAETETLRKDAELLANRVRQDHKVNGTIDQIKAQFEAALSAIHEATDGVLEGCGIHEAVAVLISQRDNARDAAEQYRGDSLKLKTLAPKLADCEQALEQSNRVLRMIDELNSIELPNESDALTRAEKAEAERDNARACAIAYRDKLRELGVESVFPVLMD
jgi:uncharacterized coiled-coil DUF342 family protein